MHGHRAQFDIFFGYKLVYFYVICLYTVLNIKESPSDIGSKYKQ